jgi:MoxR-like ATPase
MGEQSKGGESSQGAGQAPQGDRAGGGESHEGKEGGEQSQGGDRGTQGAGQAPQGEGTQGAGQAPQGEQSQGAGQAPQGEQSQGEGGGEQSAPQPQPQPPQPSGEFADGTPRPVPFTDKEWKVRLAAAKVKSPHPLLRKVVEYTRQKINVYLVGPAGCGKSYLAGQVAAILGLDYGFISVTAGMSESQLLGWRMPIGEGMAFGYVPSQFVNRYKHGGVFLLDECDAADANTLLVLNESLANGHLAVPQCIESPIIDRHPDSIIMAAGNTLPGGGGDEMYTGRSAMDASTGDRFLVIAMDYDARFMASLFPGVELPRAAASWKPTGAAPTVEMFRLAHAAYVQIAANVKRHKLPRIMSYRFGQKLSAMLYAGATVEEGLADLLAGWTDDERRSAMQGVQS